MNNLTRLPFFISTILTSSLLLLFNGCQADTKPIQIIKNGSTDYIIVTGTEGLYDSFAVGEFKEIMKKSTGVLFKSVKANSAKSSTSKTRIFIGVSPQIRKILGDKTIEMLKESESLVTRNGTDIVIVGGGRKGTSYGVYSFLEKEIGYRHFVPEPDGELIPTYKDLTYSGKEYREYPAFDMERRLSMLYLYNDTASLYQYRNRGNISPYVDRTKMKGMREEHPPLDSGHGFDLYITPANRINFYKWKEPKDYFKTNPEFFSLNSTGVRTRRLQLCFSNPDLRKEFANRIIERGKRMGGKGILTIGANDWSGSFCFCSKCKALEKKYSCNAGPLYDFLLEFLPKLKKVLPDIYISTLAYRKKQSEFPPKNIPQMPDNFICDFAPVDDDMGQALDGTNNLGTLQNLKNWHKITKNITYWYYICINSAPYGVVERLQSDIKLIYENSVRGVQVCGLGTPGMFPMQEYVLLRLMINPYQDAWKITKEYTAYMYGAAASEMNLYIADLDRVWKENKRYRGLDASGKNIFEFTPERLIRWQVMFDSMEKKLTGNPRELKYLSIARNDVDILCLDHYLNIIKRYPKWNTTPKMLIERVRKAPIQKWYRQWKFKDRYAEVPYLTILAADKPIPAPLDKLPSEQIRQIPLCGGNWDVKDVDAACGRAKFQDFRKGDLKDGKILTFCFYDQVQKKTLSAGNIDISKATANKYELYFIGKTIITRGGLVALGHWMISASLAPYYPEGDEFHEYEIWASLKFTGPDFDTNSKDKKSRVLCDRMFIIDRKAKKN